MALTEHDKKYLSKTDQKKIEDATKEWNDANARGDKAGMEAAQNKAASVRSNAGYTTNSDGTYKSHNSSNKNSQYTGYTIGSDAGKKAAQDLAIGDTFNASDGSVWTKGNDGYITVTKNGQTYNNVYKQSDLGTLGTQQVNAGVPREYVEATLYDRLNKISNNPELAKYLNDGTFQMMYNYIQEQKDAETKAEYEALLNEYNQDRPDEYSNPYKSEIDELLNQILNRDSFSYDAMNDPLYQQYAEMYRREGDRATKNTIAEAAAGAGGMNTYAVTAAQQANSYYNSLLNDKVPELAQLAYQMYLNDIDLKVQDLGLLQNMDATQYARYRDTMTDWYNDRNFAYGTYQDAVQQSNWQANYDSNEYWNNTNYINDNYWNNKNFDFNDYWKNKEFDYNDEWKNKEWNEGLADKQYDREQAEKQAAQNNVWSIANTGVMPDDALIEAAGLDKTVVQSVANAVKAQMARGSGGGGSSYTSSSSSGPDYKAMQWEVDMEDRAYAKVMDMLSMGVKPSAADLNAAGITYEQAFAIMGNYGYGPLVDTSTSSTTSSTPTSNTPTNNKTTTNKTTSNKTTSNKTTSNQGYDGNPLAPVQDVSNSGILGLGLGPINNSTVVELADSGYIVVKNDGTVAWTSDEAKSMAQKALGLGWSH